jgi:hypothetical protein
MKEFLEALRVQRWDDHRYYHHSRINQSLHLVSALSFIVAYGLLFVDPAAAALLAWGVSMTTRQAGHFFFEPKGYDHVNQATHERKEEIKVGYNLRRKVVLMAAWAAAPVLLWLAPSLGGLERLAARRGDGLAGAGRGRTAVPHRAPLLPGRRAHRPGVGDENPHRPLPRRDAVLALAAAPVARRTHRSHAPRPAPLRPGAATGLRSGG